VWFDGRGSARRCARYACARKRKIVATRGSIVDSSDTSENPACGLARPTVVELPTAWVVSATRGDGETGFEELATYAVVGSSNAVG